MGHERGKPCIVFNRWITLIAGICICIITGTSYMFAVFGPFIKANMHYTETQIQMVATIASISTYFGLLPGVMLDKLGPRVTGISHAVLLFVGYFFMWLALQHYIPSDFIVVGLFRCLAMLGSGGLYVIAVGANIHNFPARHKGKVVGALAAGLGLSSAIFTEIYSLFFHGNLMLFLLCLSAFLGIVGIVGTIFINYLPKDNPIIPIDIQSDPDQESLKSLQEKVEEVKDELDVRYLHLFKHPSFYILFFALASGTGAGLCMMTNLGDLVIALGGKDGSQDTFVTVLSLTNFMGRAIMGFLGDKLRDYANRPIFLGISFAIMGGSYLYLGFVTSIDWLYPGIIGIGLAYGGIWALIPVLVNELYGEKYWGGNNAIFGLASALGAFLQGTLLASSIYQSHIEGGGTECYGPKCYQETFFIISGIVVFGIVLVMVLSVMTRKHFAILRKMTAAEDLKDARKTERESLLKLHEADD
eukprot:TRINITY_DN187_c1_g3_i1.p1 TRINITY_DN187_c1_g3~~TRINITY_DN187_c1_g3_i1.p1  ORF type:complete len:473 (-),score=113.64 TRINITY_DN187_c1_g3_i1:21-1439(-)